MKKLARSNPLAPRKLVLRRETVRVLRQLALQELRDAHGGLTRPACEDSPPPPFSVWCD
jgi:hypothetical protein